MRRDDITDLPDAPMNRYGKPTASIFETLPPAGVDIVL